MQNALGPVVLIRPRWITAATGLYGLLLVFVILALSNFLVAGAPAGETGHGFIVRYPDVHMFVYVLERKHVVMWNVDAFRVHASFDIPQEIAKDDPGGSEGWLGLDVVPTGADRLVSLSWFRHVVFDTQLKQVISVGKVPGYPQWRYLERGRTLGVVKSQGDNAQDRYIAYDLATGEERHRWTRPQWPEDTLDGDCMVPPEFFHPKGLIAAMLVEPKDAEKQYREMPPPKKMPNGAIEIRRLSESVVLWDLGARRQLWKVDERHPGFFLVFSADGSRLAVTCSGVPEVWDTASGKSLARLVGTSSNGLHTAQFSPCGRYLLWSTDSNRALLWDWRSNVAKQGFVVPGIDDRLRDSSGPSYYHAMFSSDGKRIVVAAHNLRVYEFDVSTGKLQRQASVIGDVGNESTKVLVLDRM